MTPLKRLTDPSLQFLVWLEWIMLGLAAVGEFSKLAQSIPDRVPILAFLCIIALGLLGLRLPSGTSIQKIIYLLLHLTLVIIATVIGKVQLFFLLCIVLMLRSCLLFNRQGRWLTMGGLVTTFIILQSHRWSTIDSSRIVNHIQDIRFFIVGPIILFSLTLVLLNLLMNALLTERKLREALSNANTKLRDYSLKIEQVATLQERTRVAREIHDAIGHSLTALNLHLGAASGLWETDPSEAKTLLDEAKTLSQSALQDVRTSISTLRRDPLEQKDLKTLLQELITQLKQTTGITTKVNLQLPPSLSRSIETTVYRILQEAITNITKHAEATEVTIATQMAANYLRLKIHDNGQGFSPDENLSGFGLRGMEERVLALGGTIEIDSQIHQGCKIQVQLPL